jgi:hypothetical protein
MFRYGLVGGTIMYGGAAALFGYLGKINKNNKRV